MDTNLRRRIRAGDHDAFGELFDACARSVYNHAYRLTGDWSTAEDIVSLTFLEAWRLRESLDGTGGPIRPWLLGIATNVARNTRRTMRRHAAALARLPPAAVVSDFADEIAGRLDDAAQLALVQEALRRLRRPEREVLALCVWSGLDYTTAARALGVPVGTVRSRLSRARKKLAKHMEPPHTPRQMKGDRTPAVGPLKEGNR
ncbi:RNA polymerase subunit sigma-70 [Streptomyces sp. V2]|uniref:RNA polymerase sigma factor n=1 Tax=Streptomyces niveiscabiei TaxID=164115 RepID=A0ABW9HZN9_9ACTN|nr:MULTISPECIES: RNA polymerase sigma factor [unclassified Streptomyces]PWG10194.1 RNA polymerase subunit sigma-70 [Streptomyces sp. V2]QZZ29473.1 RNA polymerase sigma factor [Streptomyces sp. ST1015]